MLDQSKFETEGQHELRILHLLKGALRLRDAKFLPFVSRTQEGFCLFIRFVLFFRYGNNHLNVLNPIPGIQLNIKT